MFKRNFHIGNVAALLVIIALLFGGCSKKKKKDTKKVATTQFDIPVVGEEVENFYDDSVSDFAFVDEDDFEDFRDADWDTSQNVALAETKDSGDEELISDDLDEILDSLEGEGVDDLDDDLDIGNLDIDDLDMAGEVMSYISTYIENNYPNMTDDETMSVVEKAIEVEDFESMDNDARAKALEAIIADFDIVVDEEDEDNNKVGWAFTAQ